MNKDLTHITIVLDNSGSMESIKPSIEQALQSFVLEQSQAPGVCRFSLYRFSSDVFLACQNVLMPEVKLTPYGLTALYDAVGRAIDETGVRLADLPEHERPAKVLVVIVSDGIENYSHHVTRLQVAEKIRHQRDKYSWEFIFMGCNQDALLEGGKIGVRVDTCCTHNITRESIMHSYGAMSCAVKSYRAGAELKINPKG